MRLNTIVTLTASAAFGIMAVVLARGWIDDAVSDELRANIPAINTISPQAERDSRQVSIVVADADFSFGDELTPQALRLVDFPQDAVPQGAFTSLDDMFPDMDQRTIVLSRIAYNEPILDFRISGPGGRGTLSALITQGMRAVAIRVNDVAGVGGFVMPGDYVDLIYTYDPETRRNGNNLASVVLLQNIRVLGIDQNLNTDGAAPDVAKTVTVEVNNNDAQKLNLAMDSGKLSLTLRRSGETEVQTTALISARSLITAPSKKQRVRRPVVKKHPVQSDISGTAQVTIIRGETREPVNVVSEAKSTQDVLAGG